MALLWLLSCLTLVSAANLGCDPNFDYATVPYSFMWEKNNPRTPSCTGTFVGENWLITTASCKHFYKHGFYVVLSIHLPLSGKSYDLKNSMYKVIIHPQYTTHGIDIALIKLLNDISIKEHIKPVCLPVDSEEHKYERCTTSGCFLSLLPGKLSPPTELLSPEESHRKTDGLGVLFNPSDMVKCVRLDMQVLNNTDCQRYWKMRIQSTMICGNEASAPSCPATKRAPSFTLETGSPFMCERNGTWTLLGVASFGLSFTSSMFYAPVVFTRISNFTEWINQTIAAN